MYICMYVYICIYICVCVYIYIYVYFLLLFLSISLEGRTCCSQELKEVSPEQHRHGNVGGLGALHL